VTGWAPLVALAVLATSCAAPPTDIVVTGTVRDETVNVPVPSLVAPAVDLDAGFAADPTATDGASPPQAPAAPVLAGAVIVATVAVRQGAHVEAGDRLATLDSNAQKAAIAIAKADAAVADAQVAVLAQAIKDADDQAATLTNQRAKVVKAIGDLKKAQKALPAAQKKLSATRKQLAAKLAQLEQALASLPPPGTPVPPGVTLPDRDQLLQGIAQLKAALKQIDAGLKQLAAAKKQLATGLKKATSGLRKLDDARATLNDARAELRDLKKLAQVAADSSHVSIDTANWQAGLTTVTAPASGTIVSIVDAGTAHTPGSPLAVIRPDGPRLVDAWVTPAQRAQLALGDSATVQGDWMAASVSGSLRVIGVRATYPPSSTPSEETHLTRAFPITVQTSGTLPAGVPVTITFAR